jgi:hypothetical protein
MAEVKVTVPDPTPTTDDSGIGLDSYHRPPLSDKPETREATAAALRHPGVVVEGMPPPPTGGDTGATGATGGAYQAKHHPGAIGR